MSEMPREEPEWVQRMRAAGYNIRVGTLDEPMSYLPDAFFYPPPGVPRRLVRRLDATCRGVFRANGSARVRHAPLP